MGRFVGIMIGGVAAVGLVVSGCSTTEESSADDATIQSAGDFCQQAEGMQTRYSAAIEKLAGEGKLQDEEALKELENQLVEDVRGLQDSLPEDAPEDVQVAFQNAVTSIESGEDAEESAQDEADNEKLAAYMTEQCPDLGVAASGAASSPAESASPAK